MRHAVAIDGREGVVIRYNISKKHLLILVGLNHKYANETIVSNLYYDWVKTTDTLLCALPMFLSLGNRHKIRSEGEGLN
jgi:hypothetical protein